MINFLMSKLFNPVLLMTISSSVFWVSGCSFSNHSSPRQHSEDMAQIHHGENTESDAHMNHGSHDKNPDRNSVATPDNSHRRSTTQAQLTVPPNIAPSQPIPLEIQITDSAGKPIPKFDIFQEKLLHAIAISNDLKFYNHIHPAYQENGKFTTTTIFPKPGNYTIFLDYKPTGEAERVSLVTLTVPGTPEAASIPDFTRSKTINEIQVELSLSTPNIKPNEDVMLQFDLKDADGAPVELQPYLGERGHLVIVQKGDRLTDKSYLHAHAMRNSPTGQVQFHTQFLKSGLYKIWGQFNREGQILTADFWVEVEE
jgi:hypothetical protein